MTTTVSVNGFQCKNCTDIAYAQKHIDPAHPKDGPYGINAQPKDTAATSAADRTSDSPAVRFGGALTSADPSQTTAQAVTRVPPSARLLDVRI